MIAWMLVGCHGGDPQADPATTPPATSVTGDTGPAGRPRLTSPAEAVDLDPAPDVLHVELVAGVTDAGYAYSGQVPGPTLRAKVGDTLVVDLRNELADPTTIHWHGVAVPYDMDGVTWQQAPVPAGGSFTYTFRLTRAGTFWYHPHFDTAHQVDLGLYGALVVEDPQAPAADEELVVVLDSFGEEQAAETDPHLVDPTAVAWALNGLVDPELRVPGGSVVRVRLINASNAGYLHLTDQRVIATDQGWLAEGFDGDLLLAPGDRAEVEWRVGAGSDVTHLPFTVAGGSLGSEAERLLTVVADPPAAEPVGLPWPTTGGLPTPDPGRTDVRLLLTGSPELGWEINGETFPDVTVPELALGSDVVVEVRNVSPAHHPFHLHGHAFEVLSVDGVPPPVLTIEDTLDVDLVQVVRLRFLADNPGSWMAHCHVLPHAEGGMMTVLDVR